MYLNPADPYSSTPPGRLSTGAMYGIGAALLIALGGGYYYMSKKAADDKVTADKKAADDKAKTGAGEGVTYVSVFKADKAGPALDVPTAQMSLAALKTLWGSKATYAVDGPFNSEEQKTFNALEKYASNPPVILLSVDKTGTVLGIANLQTAA